MGRPETEAADTTEGSRAALWIACGGIALMSLALLALVFMWVEFTGGDYFGEAEYTVIEKWTAVLAALGVAGLGLIAVGVAAAVSHLARR